MDLGYARVSTVKQDLDRQIDALTAVGIPLERIYLDKKSGSTVDRPGLRELIAYAREGDVIVVHTLDRLGRTVRDTLNLIHELSERGVGVRNLADPIKVDSSNPEDPMAQLAVVLLALFGQMERTYTMERAAHARAVATAKGRRVGRPVLVDAAKVDYAAHLRGVPTTSLCGTTLSVSRRCSLLRDSRGASVDAARSLETGAEGSGRGSAVQDAASASPGDCRASARTRVRGYDVVRRARAA